MIHQAIPITSDESYTLCITPRCAPPQAVDFTEQLRRSTFTGTATHSPPEMLRGDPNPDYSYDIYAFGILMYEIVSLTPVYAGLSDRQVAQQVRARVAARVRGWDAVRVAVVAAGWWGWAALVADQWFERTISHMVLCQSRPRAPRPAHRAGGVQRWCDFFCILCAAPQVVYNGQVIIDTN